MRGFYVPPHEPSSPDTLLVGLLSQYPVRVKGLRVRLVSWVSARVYCYQVIALPLFGHCLDSGAEWGFLHCRYLAAAQLPYAGKGFSPHQVVGVIIECAVTRLSHAIIWPLLRLKGTVKDITIPLFCVAQTLCISRVFLLTPRSTGPCQVCRVRRGVQAAPG